MSKKRGSSEDDDDDEEEEEEQGEEESKRKRKLSSRGGFSSCSRSQGRSTSKGVPRECGKRGTQPGKGASIAPRKRQLKPHRQQKEKKLTLAWRSRSPALVSLPSLSLSPSKPKHPILLRRECCCEASDAHRDEAEAMSGKGGEDRVERRCEKIDTAWLRTKKRLLAAFAADLVRMNFCSPAAFPLF